MKKLFLLIALCFLGNVSFGLTYWYGCHGGKAFWIEAEGDQIVHLVTLGPCTGEYINFAYLVSNANPLPGGLSSNQEWETLLNTVSASDFHSPDGSDHDNSLVELLQANYTNTEGALYINVDNLNPSVRQHFIQH